MNAVDAAPSCDQSRSTAVCSVPRARCPARRFKPSAWVRGVQRTAAQGDGIIVNDTIQASHDWLANTRASALAWWIPQVAIIGGLFVPVPIRAAIWIIALLWMGTACMLNARGWPLVGSQVGAATLLPALGVRAVSPPSHSSMRRTWF